MKTPTTHTAPRAYTNIIMYWRAHAKRVPGISIPPSCSAESPGWRQRSLQRRHFRAPSWFLRQALNVLSRENITSCETVLWMHACVWVRVGSCDLRIAGSHQRHCFVKTHVLVCGMHRSACCLIMRHTLCPHMTVIPLTAVNILGYLSWRSFSALTGPRSQQCGLSVRSIKKSVHWTRVNGSA